MSFRGLFRKRISIKEGERILAEYCRINGFEDNTTQWKKPSHAKHWFAYHIGTRKIISRNWISFHYMRENNRYSIWIDLVTEEIRENLKVPG